MRQGLIYSATNVSKQSIVVNINANRWQVTMFFLDTSMIDTYQHKATLYNCNYILMSAVY